MKREKNSGIPWRLWASLCLWTLVLASALMGARGVRRFMLTDPRFTLRPGISMEGLAWTSRTAVLRTFTPDFGRSVFTVPLPERRRRLLAIGWVADASVSRLWPNRLLVRIQERHPVAFVNIPGSRIFLIDEEGVLLDEPPRSRFAFPILSGITEDQTEIERRPRVRAMLRLMNDLGSQGKDISEIDASSPENLKMVVQVEGRAVKLIMGDRNFGRRFENFVTHYAEIRKHAGSATTFDLRLDDRITAGIRD